MSHHSDTVPAPDPTRTTPPLIEARVSVPDAATGRHVAHDLVGRRQAACVQVLGPITSVYAWQGEVTQEEEWLLLVKTTAEAFAGMVETVRSVHPYDVPEVIAVPVSHALAEYAQWVQEGSSGSNEPPG